MNQETSPRKRAPQPIDAAANPKALLRKATVAAVTGLAERTIELYVQRGIFPRPVRVGIRGVRWVAAEVLAWNEARKEQTAP